jgi:hypothetical protein
MYRMPGTFSTAATATAVGPHEWNSLEIDRRSHKSDTLGISH